jgi:hypothetical protein
VQVFGEGALRQEHNMLRSIAGALAGVITAFATIFAVEAIGHQFFPPPPGIAANTPAAMAEFMKAAPVGALLSVLIAWCLGALVGGFVAAWISQKNRAMVALFPAGLVLTGVIGMLTMVSHPLWMAIPAVVLPIPLAFLGAQLAPKGKAAKELS